LFLTKLGFFPALLIVPIWIGPSWDPTVGECECLKWAIGCFPIGANMGIFVGQSRGQLRLPSVGQWLGP